VAFALSALLSPYLVIPAGTVGIVATATSTRRDFLQWTAVSIFFSTILPAIYVLVQILRGKITDVHVMEREQRSGPFVAALASSMAGALVLREMGAPLVVWGIGVVLFCNGIVMLWITKFWKISIHIAVLSATIIMALRMIHSLEPWRLLWMVPVLIWARIMRGRHTLWQGLAGCAVACAITTFVLYSLHIVQAHDLPAHLLLR
jgi:hypothetical protein